MVHLPWLFDTHTRVLRFIGIFSKCYQYYYLVIITSENVESNYVKKGEFNPGVLAGSYIGEVRSDITTSFFILLAIFFPSVTGKFTNCWNYCLHVFSSFKVQSRNEMKNITVRI